MSLLHYFVKKYSYSTTHRYMYSQYIKSWRHTVVSFQISGGKESNWIDKVREVGSLSINVVVGLEKSSLSWVVVSYDKRNTGFKSPLPPAMCPH